MYFKQLLLRQIGPESFISMSLKIINVFLYAFYNSNLKVIILSLEQFFIYTSEFLSNFLWILYTYLTAQIKTRYVTCRSQQFTGNLDLGIWISTLPL